MTTSEHIQPHHLQRHAVVYPRQSTPQQVLNHQESLRLQYALTERACAFGWDASDVQVIDDDLGVTGSSTVGRPGFQELVSRVNLGQVGIIFAYDVTRLARNCADWYQLLDLCGYRRCLVGDQETVYDPATPNGRLILGLKGLIAEMELHTIKMRLHDSLINKARRGDLALRVPGGLVRDLSGRVVQHPDQEVRERIAFVFATFLRVKSVHGVVREMVAARLLLPRGKRGRDDGTIVWRRPTAAAISSLLHNPAYAGTFAYGRTQTYANVPGGRPCKHSLPQEQWQFMVPDKYAAYIDRDTYATIQAILRDNYQEYQRRRSRGVARSGAALLQGLAYCGHCGKRRQVRMPTCAMLPRLKCTSSTRPISPRWTSPIRSAASWPISWLTTVQQWLRQSRGAPHLSRRHCRRNQLPPSHEPAPSGLPNRRIVGTGNQERGQVELTPLFAECSSRKSTLATLFG